MPGISYDESGSLASYFGVTFLAVVLLPTTYYVVRPDTRERPKLQPGGSTFQQHASALLAAETSKRRRRFLRNIIPVILGWAIFVYLCYRIAVAPAIEGGTIYNPFEVLGIPDTSTPQQIKKHYKKISLLFHPDKIKLAINQTMEEAQEKFVTLTKAYKALTDEVTRENLAKYGNPDGPQQREDKIAIPQWVVEGRNSIWVLGAYGLVLGGGIPFIVGRWWFSQRRLTRDGILSPTAEIFFHQLREDTDFPSLVTLLASAVEFQALVGTRKKAGKKERKEMQAKVEELELEVDGRIRGTGIVESPTMRRESRLQPRTAVARKARALLWAHMLRIDLDEGSKNDLQAILKATPPLLNALLNVSLAHNWLDTTLAILRLQPCLVQAIPDTASPLAQLPGVSLEKGEELQITQGAEGRRWMEKIVKADVKGIDEAMEVAKTWPRLEITQAEFRVVGEKVVSPSSIVQLAFKVRYNYPTTHIGSISPAKPKLLENHEAPVPSVNGVDEKSGAGDQASVSEIEDAVDAVTKGDAENKEQDMDVKEKVREVKEEIVAVAQQAEAAVKVGRKGKVADETEQKKVWPSNAFAHAPRWPALRKPHYHILLSDTKLDKVIVPPVRITDIPLPRADGLPSDPREFSIQFQAPPQPNLYSFVLQANSDTFVGADVSLPIMMKVENPPPEGESDGEEDISEPEEDSLAGQMAMMRGGKVKPSAVHGHAHEHEDSEDEEWSSEYESSSDEDGPKAKAKTGSRKGKAINEDSDSDSD